MILDYDGRQLAQDLADHLRRAGWLAFTEIQIPGTGGRVDVAAAMPRRYFRKDLRAYEIKVSKADFRNDEGTNKWRRYLQVFHRVYFAAPAGLLTAKDIPEDAGLIVRGNNGWHVVKAARSHIPPKLTADAVLALLYRGYYENREIRRLADRVVIDENLAIEDRVKKLGREVARKLAGGRNRQNERLRTLADVVGRIKFDPSYNWRDKIDELQSALEAALALRDQVDLLRKIGSYLQNIEYPSTENKKQIEQVVGYQR